MLCLTISGFDSDPDRVTDILGLAPTEVGRLGDLTRSGRPRRFNAWWLDVHEARLTHGSIASNALDDLLRMLKGREQNFSTLRKVIGPKNVHIYGGLYHETGKQCGIWLTVEQMRLLAALGIQWGLDLFSGEP